MAKWFCGSGFAWPANVARFSSCARTVIGDNAIAVSLAASKPGFGSGAAPTADTNRVRKDGSIIATGSGNTGTAARKRA